MHLVRREHEEFEMQDEPRGPKNKVGPSIFPVLDSGSDSEEDGDTTSNAIWPWKSRTGARNAKNASKMDVRDRMGAR